MKLSLAFDFEVRLRRKNRIAPTVIARDHLPDDRGHKMVSIIQPTYFAYAAPRTGNWEPRGGERESGTAEARKSVAKSLGKEKTVGCSLICEICELYELYEICEVI